jgi:glycine betaine/proline transport system substrate-binding protein
MIVDRRRRELLARVPAVAALMASRPSALRAAGGPVVLGQVGLSFYAVVGQVVALMLERAGHDVEIVEGQHAEIFPELGSGRLDFLAAAWLPNGHAALFAAVEARVERVAALYGGARFFLAVPAAIPAGTVGSIADLARPEIAARMAREIVSLPEATGLTQGLRRVIAAYGLGAAGYAARPDTPSAWLDAARAAFEADAWTPAPLWAPHWLNAAYAPRALADPMGAWGGEDAAWLRAHRERAARLPAATRSMLSRIRLTVEDVTAMDLAVNVEGLSPSDAARRWADQNADLVADWSGTR